MTHTGRAGLRGSVAIGFGLVALCCGLVGINGCGSSAGSASVPSAAGSSASADRGRAVFTVTWPAPTPTRLIPVAAQSIKVRLLSVDGGTVLGESVLVRPSSGGNTTASFDRLPLGTLLVTAMAYPTTDGSGVAQAEAQTTVTVVYDQAVPVTLTMGSTIAALDVSSTTTLAVGATALITATPRDAQGRVVLITRDTLQWVSSGANIAAVDATGKISALAPGQVTLTVTETESGKTGSIALVVSPPPTPNPVTAQATAYQINAAHSGSVTFNQALNFPSAPTWSVTLPGNVSYPLIAGGRVFVTCSKPGEEYGTLLYAFDKATGQIVWGPIPLGGAYHWSGLTYEKGKVFVIDYGGVMQSFDAATGTRGWSTDLPGQSYTAPPTAMNGIVYTGGPSSLYAVSESDGRVLWRTSVQNGDTSSPAVATDGAGASTGVFVSYPCQVYGVNPQTGFFQWHDDGPCGGGGGTTPAYRNGYLYVRDSEGNTIFDAKTGARVGAFNTFTIPAIGETMGFYRGGNGLQGVNLASRQVQWNFAGDGNLTSAPLLIDQTVVVGSGSGKVYALNAATGAVIWTGTVPAAIEPPDELEVFYPLTGLAAGEGYLVVPAGATLTAWRLAGP